MAQFRWDGAIFDLLDDVQRWTLREIIAVQDHLGMPVERLDKTRRMLANLWVSVHRVRPEFTLDQAGEVTIGEPEEVPPPPSPDAEPPAEPDDEPAGVVLTPSNGGGD